MDTNKNRGNSKQHVVGGSNRDKDTTITHQDERSGRAKRASKNKDTGRKFVGKSQHQNCSLPMVITVTNEICNSINHYEQMCGIFCNSFPNIY